MAGQARASTSASSSSSAAIAATFASGLPVSPPLPPIRHSSSARTLRNDYPEPPSTPPNKHRRPIGKSHRGSSGKGKEPEGSRAYSSATQRERRREHADPVITARGDPRHSHGLSWSSNTRDSLVDNLLMSLDELSQLANHNIDDLVRERERQTQWDRHDAFSAMALPPRTRARGHTYSSSMSSDQPLPESPMSSASQTRHSLLNGRMRSRKSSATDSQREALEKIHSEVGHARGYSNASSTDNGYATALETPKLALGGARSISLDHIHRSASQHNHAADSVIARGRPVPSIYSRYESSFDAAPEPMVFAGPRQMQRPNATGPVYVNPAPKASALRKITTQSDLRAVSSPTVPQDIRDKASDFVRASSMRDNGSNGNTAGSVHMPADRNAALSSTPPVPAMRKDAQSPPRERPGFFKRVFGGGSSSNKSVNERQDVPSRQPSGGLVQQDSMVQIPPPKPDSRSASVEQGVPGQMPPQLNKKPSSFFRRRKKSTSEAERPPPPPALSAADQAMLAQSRASVSSLRKVMDPYLSERDANVSGGHSNRDMTRPMTSASIMSDDDLDIFHAGYSAASDVALSKSMVDLASKENDSPRMKVKQRNKPRTTEPRPASTPHSRPSDSSAAPFDSVFRDRPTIAPINVNGDTSHIEQPKVSPLSDLAPPPDLRRRSSAAVSSADEATPEMREFSAGNNVDLHLDNESWLGANNRAVQDRSDSRPPTNLDSHSPLSPVTSTETSQPPDSAQEGQHNTEEQERARQIFDGEETTISKMDAASWLGDLKNTQTLHEYMRLYDFAKMNILTALRTLCGKLLLRGETQQFDRIITALSARWCESNPNHGFKAQDVVHTINYSLILLNTDLHLADIAEKMSRSAYVKNTLPTVRRVVADAAPNAFDETAKLTPRDPARPSVPWMDGSQPPSPAFPPDTPQERTSFESGRPAVSKRNSMRPGVFRIDSDSLSAEILGSNSLVSAPMNSSMRAWETEIEAILKSFFNSIKTEPLPLLALSRPGQAAADPSWLTSSQDGMARDARSLSAQESGLHRTGSTISRAPSEIGGRNRGLRSLTMGWQARNNRSRQKVFMTNTMASSRTSFDDSQSVLSPTQSSTWSKNSQGKTLTSSSMNSLAASYMRSDREFQHSIGFANALSHAIIREEGGGIVPADTDSFTIRGDLLEDETLALEGAPWAKEGMLKHKHHLEGPERKAKERSWNECFAVIGRGKLTLFNFNTEVKTRSLGRPRTKQGQQTPSIAGSRVGGGDWMENAEQLGVFVLRHTISTTLPKPGYSKSRPYVWALSLPSGAVHLFQVGTPEIAREWMTTANYWSARLSKEPLSGGVSNIEYGWSDSVINTAILEKSASFNSPPSSMLNKQHSHTHSASNSTVPPRQSLNSSIRGSFDIGGGSRQRLPGDKAHITDWSPPSQSIMASQLPEADQLRSLLNYVASVEVDLEKHHELKHAIELAYSPRHFNYNKAMTNWQRKSEYLLREAVKFRTYIDSLNAAQLQKEEVYNRRAERSGKNTVSATLPVTPQSTKTATNPGLSLGEDLAATVSNISASTVSSHGMDTQPTAS